jgi:hypothetical protein
VEETTAREFLEMALETLKAEKPNDRSELDRRHAIVITEIEKVIAYYDQFIAKR